MWMANLKGRQREPAAPTAARLIGCRGRAHGAADADVGIHDVVFFSPLYLVPVLHKIVCRQQYWCFGQDLS